MITVVPPSSPSAAAPLVDSDSGKLITSGRIRDVTSANSIYTGMVNTDRIASRNRARIQSCIDGAPPKGYMGGWWSGTDSVATPNNRETAINWGDAEEIVNQEKAPYIDLLFSTENFGSCPINNDYMDVESRQDWQEIISEEITRTLRAWPLFVPRKLLNISYMKTHGLSFEFFGDEVNWQWDTAGLQDFKFPSMAKLGVENIKYCAVKVPMAPEDLYKKVKNPEAAAAGWNIPATKQFVMDAAPSTPSRTDWEAWEQQWKNNDYMMSQDGNVCMGIFMWSQELNGTVTQMLFREDGEGDFLFYKKGRFHEMREFLTIYMENVGTNGKLRSIRGLGHRIYSMVQTLNRKVNSFSDLVDLACTPIFQPSVDVDMDSEITQQNGPFTIMAPGWTMPDRKSPDYESSMLPAISMFSSMLQNRSSSQGKQSQYLNSPQKIANKQVEIQMAESAQLSDSAMNLYMDASENWWQQVVRRICRKGYLPKEPGGVEAADMRRRCFERGVPEEAIYNVDYRSARVSRGIGAGSAQARIVTLDRLEQEAPAFDPVAQQLFVRDKVRAIAGQQAADRYTPKPKDRIAPVDAGIAQTENAALVGGQPIEPLAGQNVVVHLQVHLARISQFNDQIVEGGEPALVQNIQPMGAILQHVKDTLGMANAEDPKIKELTKQAQKFDEIVSNGVKHVQKLQDNAQREMEHNSGKIGDQQVDPATGQPQPQGQDQGTQDSSSRLAETEAVKLQTQLHDLNYRAQKADLDLTTSRRKAEQAIELENIKAAADISRS